MSEPKRERIGEAELAAVEELCLSDNGQVEQASAIGPAERAECARERERIAAVFSYLRRLRGLIVDARESLVLANAWDLEGPIVPLRAEAEAIRAERGSYLHSSVEQKYEAGKPERR